VKVRLIPKEARRNATTELSKSPMAVQRCGGRRECIGLGNQDLASATRTERRCSMQRGVAEAISSANASRARGHSSENVVAAASFASHSNV
jgi:hypothetical protein